MQETDKSWLTVEDGVSVSEVFKMFKDAITTVEVEVVGYRPLSGRRKGTDEIKKALVGKRSIV